jgi:hypothetical protein
LHTIKNQQIIFRKIYITLQKLFFFAASLSDKSGKTKEAIELFKEIKERFPNTQASNESDKYLAMHNIFN